MGIEMSRRQDKITFTATHMASKRSLSWNAKSKEPATEEFWTKKRRQNEIENIKLAKEKEAEKERQVEDAQTIDDLNKKVTDLVDHLEKKERKETKTVKEISEMLKSNRLALQGSIPRKQIVETEHAEELSEKNTRCTSGLRFQTSDGRFRFEEPNTTKSTALTIPSKRPKRSIFTPDPDKKEQLGGTPPPRKYRKKKTEARLARLRPIGY